MKFFLCYFLTNLSVLIPNMHGDHSLDRAPPYDIFSVTLTTDNCPTEGPHAKTRTYSESAHSN